MTVINLEKDPVALTMRVSARFDATVDRVWQIWDDPRQLERWWGPPSYPATVIDHDLTPGGVVTYFMTSPEGEKYHGWWRIVSADRPRSIEFEDGFADDAGNPTPDMPTTSVRVEFTSELPAGTSMVITTVFDSLEAMEQLVEMGMEEGIVAAMGQIDGILAATVA